VTLFADEDTVPVDGVVPRAWLDGVTDAGTGRIAPAHRRARRAGG
jgi:hypothetical protein